jgi:hypothetical protein
MRARAAWSDCGRFRKRLDSTRSPTRAPPPDGWHPRYGSITRGVPLEESDSIRTEPPSATRGGGWHPPARSIAPGVPPGAGGPAPTGTVVSAVEIAVLCDQHDDVRCLLMFLRGFPIPEPQNPGSSPRRLRR